jgi:benzodiazapine receptor
LSRSFLVACSAFIALSVSAAGVASAFTARSVRTWYPGLRKPLGNPPAKYFGPVLSVLYILMTIAACIVWRMGAGWVAASSAIIVFLIQLALNAAWSMLFFGLRAPALALIEISLLWVAILVNVVLFWKISPLSGALLIPYLIWVTYATYLNAGIWHLNKRSTN